MFLILKMAIYIFTTILKKSLYKKVKDLNQVFLVKIEMRFFSFIHKNKLVVSNIEYQRDLNKEQKFIKKQNVINLKSLRIRKINKNEIGDYEVSRGNCIWIDPKLGIGY